MPSPYLAQYPAQFVRDMGCTEREWLKWLAGIWPDHAWSESNGQALLPIAMLATTAQGQLHLTWHVLPARQIALMRIPRLQVTFRFEGVTDEARTQFMRRFDLMTQRGGG